MTENAEQLEELYLLDCGGVGNIALAWYAQFRAMEYDHHEAMARAAEKMGFADKPWYISGRAAHATRRLERLRREARRSKPKPKPRGSQ